MEEIAKESGIDLHQKDQLEEIEQPSIRKKEKKKGKKKDIDSRYVCPLMQSIYVASFPYHFWSSKMF